MNDLAAFAALLSVLILGVNVLILGLNLKLYTELLKLKRITGPLNVPRD